MLPRAMLFLALGSAIGPAAAAGPTYGAIVIDDSLGGAHGNGDYAVGQGPTAQEARRIAMSNCTLGGNVACRVKLTYRHCGAYAASTRMAGTGEGGTIPEAATAARTACKDTACHTVVADCIGLPLRPPPYPGVP